MWLLLLAVAGAEAGCTEPKQSLQSETRSRLEGEVKATVLGIGAGAASADTAKETIWSTQLASQEAVDNQWYLYYLCDEYESGRLSPAQYCAISSSLWQRITGVPMPVESCLATTPGIVVEAAPLLAPAPTVATESPADEQAPVAPVEVPAPRPTAQAPAPTVPPPSRPAPRKDVTSARWQGLVPGGKAVDLYGPINMAGVETYYLDNRMGCLSKVDQTDTGWRETILIGASCVAWGKLDVQVGDDEIVIVGDDVRFAVERQEGRKVGWTGEWAGSVYVEKQNAVKIAAAAFGSRKPTVSQFEVPLAVSFSEDGSGATSWPDTGCTGTLEASASGKTFREYVEKVSAPCMSNATITVYMMSGDAMLVQWIPSGIAIATYGVLRAQ